MNAPVREHCALNNQIFRCCEVYYSNTIIITILMQILIPNCRFENSSLPIFALKPPNRILYCTYENDRQPSPVPHKICLLNHHFYHHLVHAHSKQGYITSGLSQLHDILPLTNSTLLDDYRFLFQRKNIIPCSYDAPFVPPSLLHTH